MKYDVFISYSQKDRDLVIPFVQRISDETGAKCWIDQNGIESGAEFESKIKQAIDSSATVLFMLSDNSVSSIWTQREVFYAEKKKKRIVPVILDHRGLRDWSEIHFINIDCIEIHNPTQCEKLIRNISDWCVENEKRKVEERRLAEEKRVLEAKRLAEEKRIAEAKRLAEEKKWQEEEARRKAEIKRWSDEKKRKEEEARRRAEEEKRKEEEAKKAKLRRCLDEPREAEEQFKLAWNLEHIQGSPIEARKWYRKAAEQGHARAQYVVGCYYATATAVSRDYAEAVKWFHEAAAQGDVDAMDSLSFSYKWGQGVQKNDNEALKWACKAARHGSIVSRRFLWHRLILISLGVVLSLASIMLFFFSTGGLVLSRDIPVSILIAPFVSGIFFRASRHYGFVSMYNDDFIKGLLWLFLSSFVIFVSLLLFLIIFYKEFNWWVLIMGVVLLFLSWPFVYKAFHIHTPLF